MTIRIMMMTMRMMIMIIKMMVVMMIGYDNDVITMMMMMMMMMKIKWSKHHKSSEHSPHTNPECERERKTAREHKLSCVRVDVMNMSSQELYYRACPRINVQCHHHHHATPTHMDGSGRRDLAEGRGS